MYFKNKTEQNLEPGILAADLKDDKESLKHLFSNIDNYNVNDPETIAIDKFLDKEIAKYLEADNLKEAKYFYYETSIEWMNKNYYHPEENLLNPEYYIYKNIEPIVVNDGLGVNFVIVNIPNDYVLYTPITYIDKNINLEERLELGNEASFFSNLKGIDTGNKENETSYVIKFTCNDFSLDDKDFNIVLCQKKTYEVKDKTNTY